MHPGSNLELEVQGHSPDSNAAFAVCVLEGVYPNRRAVTACTVLCRRDKLARVLMHGSELPQAFEALISCIHTLCQQVRFSNSKPAVCCTPHPLLCQLQGGWVSCRQVPHLQGLQASCATVYRQPDGVDSGRLLNDRWPSSP
jgi:hypothetical protein